MEGRRTRFRGTRSWQPPGFGPNWVVVYCFQVAFHFYHQTPRRARWEAQISLFLVHVPPGQLKKLLPRAQPACALSATAPGLLRSPGSKEKRRKDRHVFGYLYIKKANIKALDCIQKFSVLRWICLPEAQKRSA
jgi:hypothetical protein